MFKKKFRTITNAEARDIEKNYHKPLKKATKGMFTVLMNIYDIQCELAEKHKDLAGNSNVGYHDMKAALEPIIKDEGVVLNFMRYLINIEGQFEELENKVYLGVGHIWAETYDIIEDIYTERNKKYLAKLKK